MERRTKFSAIFFFFKFCLFIRFKACKRNSFYFFHEEVCALDSRPSPHSAPWGLSLSEWELQGDRASFLDEDDNAPRLTPCTCASTAGRRIVLPGPRFPTKTASAGGCSSWLLSSVGRSSHADETFEVIITC